MTYLNRFSDMANSWQMSRHSTQIRSMIDQSAKELTTGERRGVDIARSGEAAHLVAIDRSLDMLKGFAVGMNRAQTRAEATQAGIQTIRTGSAEIMMNVLSLAKQDSFISADIQATEAVGELGRAVATLNANVAGYSLFSGAASDQPAVTDADTMLADIETILAAAPDVATAIANVDFYFDDPTGGYMTSIYSGATLDGPDVAVNEGDHVSYGVRADDPSIRTTLRNLTLVAAVANGAYAGPLAEQKALLINAGETNLTSNDGLIRIQETLGYAQERMAEGQAANEAEKTRLDLARNEVAAADPYEAAARFQELEAQLERLYTVTARLGTLSLANYMR